MKLMPFFLAGPLAGQAQPANEAIFDQEENLYYRDPSYIGKKSPHGGKILWSRGNGWVFAGLARVIRNLPKDDPQYDRYVEHFRRMAKALAAAQQDDGFWRANLGDPQHYPMPESSGAAFFVDGFGQGIRMGILERDTYLPVVIRGWCALVTTVHADGLRGWVQPVEKVEQGFYKASQTSFANNWNLVNVAGEWSRMKSGLGGDPGYVEYCLTMQLKQFTPFGMYNEKGNPLAYDLFPRHYLTGMLQRGYDSFLHTTYRDILWRGAWTSLLLPSPFGELPTGYRSSQHIWNEAEQAVIFEIHATAYARSGRMPEAGAFKRAARLSLQSIRSWLRPDGTGYIVKKRYPIGAKHGYEDYSAHTCYNMLAMSMLAQAWQFADDAIEEQPAPADRGGFVVPILEPVHKIFANAAGNYLEYDTRGDHLYNPTGLIRIHLKNGHPQLGPSDGCAAKFSGEGVNLAVGPAWRVDGKWSKLADSGDTNCQVTVLEETPQRVRFLVAHTGVRQQISIDENGATVEDSVALAGVDAIRVHFPMLVFDGKDEPAITVDRNTVQLKLSDRSVRFTVQEPQNAVWQRSGNKFNHRNGIVEDIFAESAGKRLVYRITAD